MSEDEASCINNGPRTIFCFIFRSFAFLSLLFISCLFIFFRFFISSTKTHSYIVSCPVSYPSHRRRAHQLFLSPSVLLHALNIPHRLHLPSFHLIHPHSRKTVLSLSPSLHLSSSVVSLLRWTNDTTPQTFLISPVLLLGIIYPPISALRSCWPSRIFPPTISCNNKLLFLIDTHPPQTHSQSSLSLFHSLALSPPLDIFLWLFFSALTKVIKQKNKKISEGHHLASPPTSSSSSPIAHTQRERVWEREPPLMFAYLPNGCLIILDM